jgi:hypothetical protein
MSNTVVPAEVDAVVPAKVDTGILEWLTSDDKNVERALGLEQSGAIARALSLEKLFVLSDTWHRTPATDKVAKTNARLAHACMYDKVAETIGKTLGARDKVTNWINHGTMDYKLLLGLGLVEILTRNAHAAASLGAGFLNGLKEQKDLLMFAHKKMNENKDATTANNIIELLQSFPEPKEGKSKKENSKGKMMTDERTDWVKQNVKIEDGDYKKPKKEKPPPPDNGPKQLVPATKIRKRTQTVAFNPSGDKQTGQPPPKRETPKSRNTPPKKKRKTRKGVGTEEEETGSDASGSDSDSDAAQTIKSDSDSDAAQTIMQKIESLLDKLEGMDGGLAKMTAFWENQLKRMAIKIATAKSDLVRSPVEIENVGDGDDPSPSSPKEVVGEEDLTTDKDPSASAMTSPVKLTEGTIPHLRDLPIL